MKKKIFSNIYTILVFIFLYMPIGVLVLYSFNDSNSTSTFSRFSLRWYKELFNDAASLNALKNTLILAILSAAIATVIGTMAAYGISKMKNKYVKSATMSATKIPMMNPDIVTGISMMLLFVFVGVLVFKEANMGFGTVLIAHITFNLPYVILSVLPKFKQMDKSLPEAALDLGCTPAQSFFKVELPQIMPGIISGFIMAFTLSIDDFVISYFTIGSGFETLPIRIYSMTKKRVTPDMYALSTLIFVSVLVLLIVSNLLSDKNREKLTKKAKKVTTIVVSSVFGFIATITVVVLMITAGTKTLTLNVYNWGEYISDGGEGSYDVNSAFEDYYEQWYLDEYGEKVKVKVNYTTYASNEDLYAKLKGGAGGYDIIVPSDYMLEKFKKEGLIQPLGKVETIEQAIPNMVHLNEQFKDMFVYPNENGELELYGAIYTYGVIGIVYNKDKLDPADVEKIENGEMGWEILYELEYMEKYKGQILQFNNARDALGSAMYHLGYSVNTATPEQWNEAYALLQAQKPYVQSYVMDEIYNKMESGEAALAAYYAGDCLSMIESSEQSLGFFYPKNKNGEYQTNIFADAMCIPTGSQNKELALAYIDFMMSEEAAVANAEYIYYAAPYDHVKNNFEYRIYTGKYEYVYVCELDQSGVIVYDEEGNPVYALDEEGELIHVLDSNGEKMWIDAELQSEFEAYGIDSQGNIVKLYDENNEPIMLESGGGGDYVVIYEKEFEDSLSQMFAEYAYKDLDTAEGAKISTQDLNVLWENLKVDSASFGYGIYIVCAVIVVGFVAFAVYKYVEKRRRRRLYWNNPVQAKQTFEFTSTMTKIAIPPEQRAEKGSKPKTK